MQGSCKKKGVLADIQILIYYSCPIILSFLSSVNQMEPLLSNLVNSQETPSAEQTHSSRLHQRLLDHPQQSQRHSTQSNNLKTTPLSPNQLFTLRAQVLAYKHLVRNIPLPQHQNFCIENGEWEKEKEKLRQSAVTSFKDKVEKDQQLKFMIFPNLKNISRDQYPEHEQLKFLFEKRKNQIDHLLEKGDEISPETKEKLQIQAKFLPNRELYKNIFQKITDGLKKEHRSLTIYQNTLLDRTFFRRQRLMKNEGSNKSSSKNHFRNDYDKRKRMMHKECMQNLKIHKEDFMEWHRKKIKDRKKLANQVKGYIQTKRKEKEEFEERRKIARLKQLKAQNMESYLQLVEEEKKTKIRQLLSQTNKFLKELGAKVLIQKGTVQEDVTEAVQKDQAQNLLDIFQSSNTVYYNLTHTIKEDITNQPTILEGGQLKNYQLHGLQWLVSLYNNNLNGILADQMGLGKTIQTIALICYLIEYKKNYGPFLIIAPLSTIPNWMAQFEKWAPSIRKIVYKGNPNTRNDIMKMMRTTKWNVCITTYDFILKDRLKLNKYDWKYIVIDEGHKMKNAKSKFSNILGQQYQSDHRLLLTGTPLQNNLTQLWALLNFLLPKVFNSCDDFQKWFSMAIYKNTGDESVQLDQQEQLLIINRLHQVLRPFLLRRVKKEVYSQLPDKKEHVIKVELSAWQKLIYQNISRKTALQFANNSGKISKTTLTNLMMQLRKCCNHPYLFLKNYDDISYHEWIIRSSGKFQLIDRILPKLKRFNHRVLIFTQMTHLMDIMQAYFDYRGIRHLRLDGSTKSEDRQERMRLFNEPNSQYDVFLLSTRAGGLGLNLQTADTVIIFDSDWNPQMDLQAQDRVHRIGQEKQVIVLRLITNNSIEQHILERTAFKMNLNELFIQGGLYNLNSSQAQRRKKIEDILLKTRKDTQENEQDEIIDDEMINQYIKRSDEEYEEFNRMDERRYTLEKDIYQFPEDNKKNCNYRLMKENEIPSWFIETPKNMDINKEYGRGNRIRKQINYSDEVIDDQVLNITDYYDQENNIQNQNDYTPVEVPRIKKQVKEKAPRNQVVDIEKLIQSSKPKFEEEYFQEDN